MVFVIGGAYQGKLEYATKKYNLSENEIYHCSEDNTDMPTDKKAVSGLEKWILAVVKSDDNYAKVLDEFVAGLKSEIIICNDISCGVVPIEPELRAWREAVGRVSMQISQKSDEVVRLFCSVATKIK